MNKKERLDLIERLLEEKMIEFLTNGETERLPELSTPANYVAKNNRVEEKAKQNSEQDEMKKKIEEAKKKREAK